MNARLISFLAGAVLVAAASAADSCLECHSLLEGRLQAPAAAFAADVHKHRGIGCVDCHGGNPAADDPHAARGFRGKIARTQIAQLCARCHSDATLMHKFDPKAHVDQYAQYLTSNHGKRMAAGDQAAATCTDCHSVHDIRDVKNPLSPVHPLRLPETCARCHTDVAHMAKYKLGTGQFEEYRQSVHWEALAKRRDFSAPSCASCHGNHGATPPQVRSVEMVCGTCHALLEDLYTASPHQPVFAAMGQGGCVVCHGSHEVRRPTLAMLSGPDAVCAQCHEPDSPGGETAAEMAALMGKLGAALGSSDALLERARHSGMEVSDALVRQQEGYENLVKARVAMHTFSLAEVSKPVEEGLAIAAETRRTGEEAMRERDLRRLGLGVSLIAIFITIAGLALLLRRIERAAPQAAQDTGA